MKGDFFATEDKGEVELVLRKQYGQEGEIGLMGERGVGGDSVNGGKVAFDALSKGLHGSAERCLWSSGLRRCRVWRASWRRRVFGGDVTCLVG